MKTSLSKLKTYRLLIEKYLQNAISASRLQKDFFRHMKVEPEGMDKKLFLILNDLFEDLDAYSPHWKPEDESPFRLTESSLRKEVQQAANQLDALIEELELKKDS